MKIDKQGEITMELSDVFGEGYERFINACKDDDERYKRMRGLLAFIDELETKWSSWTPEDWRTTAVQGIDWELTEEDAQRVRAYLFLFTFARKLFLKEQMRQIKHPEKFRKHIKNQRDFVRIVTSMRDAGITAGLDYNAMAKMWFDGDTEEFRKVKDKAKAAAASSKEMFTLLKSLFDGLSDIKQEEFRDYADGIVEAKKGGERFAPNPQQPKRKD